MTRHRIVQALALAATTALAGEAAAQNSGQYPLRLTSRPQTVPARTVRLDGAFNVTGIRACGMLAGSACSSSTGTSLDIGGGFGVTHELEIGGTLVPLQFSPDAYYANPSVYAHYQFLNLAPMQLGGRITLVAPVREGSRFGFQFDLPYWYNFGDQVQVRTGLSYRATFVDPINHAVAIPLQFYVSFTEQFYGALLTGLTLPLRETGKAMSIPFGVEGGFTLASADSRPMLDIVGRFNFPNFIMPGFDGDRLNAGVWEASVSGRFYLFL